MSRYRGPRVRAVRALGSALPGLTRKNGERRPYPPGQHGPTRRGRVSEYALRLKEKQKLRLNYGVSEKQLVSYMREAKAGPGNAGNRLLALLESRLDNVVFRAGLARTIPAARQMVCHGHIRVNGRRVDIPSFRVKQGQKIDLAPSARERIVKAGTLESPPSFETPWLKLDKAEATVEVLAEPALEGMPLDVAPQLVVEFYSQRL